MEVRNEAVPLRNLGVGIAYNNSPRRKEKERERESGLAGRVRAFSVPMERSPLYVDTPVTTQKIYTSPGGDSSGGGSLERKASRERVGSKILASQKTPIDEKSHY